MCTTFIFKVFLVLSSHDLVLQEKFLCILQYFLLRSDGAKMSKRKKNYPDPILVINAYGSDALRLYLINSPVVRAENLRFQVCLRFDPFTFVVYLVLLRHGFS